MIRKLLYIFGFLLCVSCNQSAPKSENTKMKSEERSVDKDVFLDDLKGKDYDFTIDKSKIDADFKSQSFSFSTPGNLNVEISTKLQANYEAQILATKHPEFAEAIKEQLADSNKFTTALLDSIETIKIEDLELSGNMESRNDSVSTQKLIYTSLINSKYKQKDSVLVVIKRAMIVIDNAMKVNTSFTFEKLD